MDNFELLELEPLINAGLSEKDAAEVMDIVRDKGFNADDALDMLRDMRDKMVKGAAVASAIDDMSAKELMEARYYNRKTRRDKNKKKGLKKLGSRKLKRD